MRKRPEPRLIGRRVVLRLPRPADLPAIRDFYSSNAEHLTEFAPVGPIENSRLKARIKVVRRQFVDDRSCRTFIFDRNDEQHILGTANLSEFIRGSFHACYLGYSLGSDAEGKGIMTESLRLLTDYAFDELNLHRISANYMPRNQRSGAVLERLGFTVEGTAKNYLRINGVWEDHVLTSLTSDRWRVPQR